MDSEIIQGPDCVRGHRQITDSKGLIEKLKRETWEGITKIRSDTDEAENKRRFKAERRRLERYQTIKNEVVQTYKKNEAAEFKWADLLELEQCEELYQKIEEQKAECEEFLSSKQKLIDDFIAELTIEDDFYMKAIRKQEEDVDKLIDYQRQQYISMRNEYAHQLEVIEETFLAERAELLKANKEEIDSLFDRHKELEAESTEKRHQLEEANAEELERIRADEAGTFHDQKILLETDLQIIEKALEEMKAIYQLNLEKLKYNVEVLTEKVEENKTTIGLLSNRKRQFKNRLINLREEISTKEKEYNDENIKLTQAFKRVSQAFNKLRRQFRHFEKADTAKFNEIWAMNEAEVRNLASKVLKSDKIIYEQQLGLAWSVPEDPTLNLDYASLSEGAPQLSSQQAGTIADESSSKAQAAQIPMAKIRQVFTLLLEECGFLIEDKVKEQCIGKSEKEAMTIQIDSIRKTLGVESMQDIQLLVNIFYDNSGRMQDDLYESEGEEVQDSDELRVDPDIVIDLLMQYQEAKSDKKGAPQQTSSGIDGGFSLKQPSQDTEKEIQEKRIIKEREHWQKLGAILPENHLRVWKALERAFSQYYGLLKSRQQLVEETGVLHQQNEELKSLLNQYLQAGVNQELLVPPTQMIRLDDEEEY